MPDEPESIYRIATDGCDTALQLAPGQELGRLYAAAPGEDGNDGNLADVGLVYNAMSRGLAPPWTKQEIAVYRAWPLESRVLELVGLTPLEFL